jgi:hypothetical protein
MNKVDEIEAEVCRSCAQQSEVLEQLKCAEYYVDPWDDTTPSSTSGCVSPTLERLHVEKRGKRHERAAADKSRFVSLSSRICF